MQEEDKFRQSFKYFKSKKQEIDFSKVIYVSDSNPDIKTLNTYPLSNELEIIRASLGVKSTHQWDVFTFQKQPGLIIIKNPFTLLGSLSWIRRCLAEYSNFPYKTNLTQLGLISEGNPWFPAVFKDLVINEKNKLINQLRWATLGYHHNWDTKEYNDEEVSPMPKELHELSQVILCGVGLSEYKNFKAEAAIVNYYPVGSTLSPHTDKSEPYKEAPLLSFSFGQSAIFLIGGQTKSIEPNPLFLNHGDVMIMMKASRLSYHAVPRILNEIDNMKLILPCFYINKFKSAILMLIEFLNEYIKTNNCSPEYTYVDISRIEWNCEKEVNHDNNAELLNFLKGNSSCFISIFKEPGFDLKSKFNLLYLKAIYHYISSMRINFNIRQVNEI